jgi:hypothetical protein
VKSLDSFDFAAIPALNKMLVLELARCAYIEQRENVIALGNSGTGKTHLALGLGLAACQKGLSVGFTTAAALVHELIEARDEKRLRRLQHQLAGYKLLIIDELGYVPLSQTGAELLFEVFSQRYERGSTLVTSNLPWLLLGSGVLASLSHQGCDEGAQEGSAAAPGVVHELEEAEIERQLLLRDAPVRAEPGAQQGPRPLHGVDVDLAEAVAILVAGVLATSMADHLVLIAPGRQAGVDLVLVGVDAGALGDDSLDDGLDCLLLHIGQHAQDHLPATLDQAEDGWLVLRQRAAARRACQPAAAAKPPPLATAAG